jgi:hypothetical protein
VETPEVERPHHHHTSRPWLDLLLGVTVPSHPHVILSSVVHNVLAAKEHILFFDVKPEDLTSEDYAAIDIGLKKIEFRACYCAVFDECWMTDSRKTQPAKVKQCPASQNAFR